MSVTVLRLIAGICLLLTASTGLAQGRADPTVSWRTLETEHFSISYPEPLGMIARRVGAAAERAHSRLAPLLDHHPSGRVQISLTDDTDVANGSASSLPFNHMSLYVTAPEDLSPLSDYDDWFSVLVTHEHTHVRHLDTVGGVPGFLNRLLGKVFAPNAVQPRWFVEGLAVHNESAETSGGRIRSTMFEMYLRMDALDGRLLSIDQLSSSVDRWPRGSAWYLYGSRFVNWIAEHYGRQALTRISHEYGRRLIPYGLNRAFRRVTGKTMNALYEEWRADVFQTAEATRERVETQGLREGERLTFQGETVRSPRFDSESSIVYTSSDGHHDTDLRRIHLTNRNFDHLQRLGGAGYVAQRGPFVYLDAEDNVNDIYFLSDLFRFDTRDQSLVRLTQGRRAHEPDVAANGRDLAFTVNSAGTTHLMVADTQDVEGTARVLLRSERFHQVYTPRWSPNGQSIAVSVWRTGGYRDIGIVDAQTGAFESITHDRAMDTGPAWDPSGNKLYFSSDRSGIANIYCYDLATQTTSQVTNVVGGAYSPDVSPSGERLVYLGYTGRGFDLWTLPLDPNAWTEAAAYDDVRPPPNLPGDYVAASDPYRPARTLYPRSYMLGFGPDGLGNALSVSLSGRDIAQFHSYSLKAAVNLENGYVSGTLDWSYRHLPAALNFSLFRNVTSGGTISVGGEDRLWVAQTLGGSAGLSYGIPRLLSYQSISGSAFVQHLSSIAPIGGVLDPDTAPVQLPREGILAGVSLGYSFSDIRKRTYDMFPTAGRSLSLQVSASHPLAAGDFRLSTFQASWTRHIGLGKHHSIAINYGVGLAGGDFGGRRAFSVGGFVDGLDFAGLATLAHRGGVAVRGYEPGAHRGNKYHLLQLEYRLPIGRIMRGISSLPIYANRLYAILFADIGNAWTGGFRLDDHLVGIGAELHFNVTFAYALPFSTRVGFAYGLMDPGGFQFYSHLGVPF